MRSYNGKVHRQVRQDTGGRGARRRDGASTADRTPNQEAQILQLLSWLVVVVVAFGFFGSVAWVVFGDVGSGITGLTLLIYGFSLFVARLLAGRRKGVAPLIIVCSGFLVATLIVAASQPGLTPVLVLGPLLAVGAALPYVSKRILSLLFVAAWLVTVAVGILGEVSPSTSALPPWYQTGFKILSLAAAVTVVLVLLWQFRSRLVGTLAEVQASEERAVHEAMHDPLTGLPNRVLLQECLDRALERTKKDPDYLVAVLFLDLDRFKNVNDSLGHSVGDRLLVAVARRLRASVHSADTVARLGGDEFTVLLEDLRAVGDAERTSERIQQRLREPFLFDEHELYVTASVGIVLQPSDYRRSEDLLRDADTAMYRAKEEGKARYKVFTPRMRTEAVRTLRLENDLRRAVEREEFTVRYQPIVSLSSGGVVGFEALARWDHPEWGLTQPEDFIPLAEETGLILPIGLSVLRQACRDADLWRSRYPDHRPLDVSVNLSAAQLAYPELPGQIEYILRNSGLSGRHLKLEVTESALMRDARTAAGALAGLRRLGIQIHIDDFGTGFSSLGTLHRFSADALKIDRSFVEGVPRRRRFRGRPDTTNHNNPGPHSRYRRGRRRRIVPRPTGVAQEDGLRLRAGLLLLATGRCRNGRGNYRLPTTVVEPRAGLPGTSSTVPR